MPKCDHCPHLVGMEHSGEGCDHCDCMYDWHGKLVESILSEIKAYFRTKDVVKTVEEDLADPPKWASAIFYGAVPWMIIIGILLGIVLGYPEIQRYPLLYWTVVGVTISVNLLTVAILQRSTDVRFNRLRDALLKHEKRLKDLESGSDAS